MKILAIETSCDETAAAVIENGEKIRSNVIASQVDIHAQFGGIVPEVAARSHIEIILPIIDQALQEANSSWGDVDAIAVTRGPGLIGSLLVGVMTAKTLALIKNKPLIGVNHIIAHAFAAFLTEKKPKFPMLALTVSGGHSALTLYQQNLNFKVLGETRDDAAGEAFDKVGKLLGLPYPGGPAISKAAAKGDPNSFKFPIAKLGDSLDFSFSGLKTAVLRQVHQISPDQPLDLRKTYRLDESSTNNIAASFESTIVKALVDNTARAYQEFHPASVVVGGGVAANDRLRRQLSKAIPDTIFVPPVLCTDNAAMIGALAFKMYGLGLLAQPEKLTADSSLEML